jgi:putative ABC transport system permease protein
MSARTLFRHYFVTASRNLVKHKLYSFINIVGLSIGLACAIFIALFVRDEVSYDKWIPGTSNLYRAEVTFHAPGRDPFSYATAPFPVLRAMQEHIPEVKATTHLAPERMTVTVGNKQFFETIAVVDPNFFQVIQLPLAEGDPANVLAQPESIVLSQSVARKYFGDIDPLGKTVTVTGSGILCDRNDAACLTAVHPLTVTGVLRDLPSNTQLAVDLLMPNSSQADGIPPAFRDHHWTGTDGIYGYVALAPGANPDTVLVKLKPLLDQLVGQNVLGGLRASELEEYHLTPFWDVHLTSDNYGGMKPPGSRATVIGFAMIGLLIIIVACFNFMNLATARATLRAREIAIRKAVGATRPQLTVQFLGESLLMALLSLVIALALVEILLPVYDAFLGRPIVFNYLTDWPLLVEIVGGAIVAGLLSGVYPALVLSSFRPADALKTSVSTQTGSGLVRMTLVVSQFAVSIGLGIAALVVFSQISFVRNMNLGFERDGVLILRGMTKLTASAAESFTRALRANPEITDVALSNGVPFDLINTNNTIAKMQGSSQSFTTRVLFASPEFPSLYGMRLVAGRLLSSSRGEDVFSSIYPFSGFSGADRDAGRNVLINAEAARRFGYDAEEAVGKTIQVGVGEARIAGVLADSKLDGVSESVSPAVYADWPDGNTLLSIRLRGDRLPETLAFIDKTWASFAPSSAIDRYFLDDAFDNLFKSDEKQGVMFSLFVGIAIAISCLGLFGVAAFTAERRTKEIGLRKAFGARTRDIVQLLLWQFSIPVLIANLIAWPVAYYYLHHWLESYAYRISLNPLYFLTAGGVALGIAWITILGHALRIARASPILALRYE